MSWKRPGWETRIAMDSAPAEIIKPAQELTEAANEIFRSKGLNRADKRTVYVQSKRAAYLIGDVYIDNLAEGRPALGNWLFVACIDLDRNGNPVSIPGQILIPRTFDVFYDRSDTLKWLYPLRTVLPEALSAAAEDLKNCRFITFKAWKALLRKAAVF